MTARQRLETYLDALRRRLRTHIYARAGAVAAAGVLVITCAAVWLLEREQFSPLVVLSGRIALVMLLLLVGALLLWLPLRWLGRDDGARAFEENLPDEQGRIQTYLDSRRREASGAKSPLVDLLAADAAAIAARTEIDTLVPARRIGVAAAVAIIGFISLALLLSVGPAHWGFGSRHLLLGIDLPRDAVPVRRVVVTPGDATVRRNSDLAIRATVEGFTPKDAQVYVRFAGQQQWERAPMRAATQEQGSQFEFKLYAVRAPLQYYVDADGTKSSDHKVGVVDLPRIERVRLTYQYPDWTGLEPKVDEASRDIRAVAGTDVKVEVFADAPLVAPALIVDGESEELSQQGSTSTGTVAVAKPGRYQIGARVADEFVALSDEYAIEIVADEKPVVEIVKPARDWRATSIEEVPVRIQAADDFRLRDVALRYSVNGGAWKAVSVGGGAKQTDGESWLRMEELGKQVASAEKRLVPGDLVSYYAVAKDRKQTVETDLFMVQVQPFERRFTQGQGGGGGGGMGDEQGAISERQREILLATWNLQRSDERNARSRQQLEDSAKMLADLQSTLATQARTLAERTRARAAVEEDERVRTFIESLERAAAAMEPAARNLSEFKLRDAVPAEQQALQQLLRAEAAFRDVQVSMQQGGSEGSGSQTARNFTEMFELEMDLEKNQYENQSQLSMQQTQADIDEAIRKLKELAQRQERLAQERNQQRQTPEQRWRQEQLRREAEDLRRRLEQMNGGQQSSSQSASARGQERGSERGGERGTERARDQRQGSQVAQALESVNRALEEMQAANAGAEGDQERAAQSAREAVRNLREALKEMDRRKPSTLDDTLEQFAERTQRLAQDQRKVENDLHQAISTASRSSQRYNSRGAIDQRSAQELIQSKQRMASELTSLQRDMRNAVHEHRKQAPETTQRLGEIVRDIEDSDIMYRLNQSAAEIYYGRARDAAPREGLITDTIDMLQQELREAAALAAREKRSTPNEAAPDELLAEVAELRRALQDAARAGPESAGRERAESPRRSAANDERGSSGEQSNGSSGASSGLAAWDPAAPTAPLSSLRDGWGSLMPQTARISERIRDLTNRMSRGELSQSELELLRRTANELRRLSGDPMAGQTAAMLKLVDQIELTALAAADRAQEGTPARATLPDPDSPRYREAVAEYYRRLGNR